MFAKAARGRIASWNNFSNAMKSTIIEQYDGGNLKSYKGMWKRKFKTHAGKLQLSIQKNQNDFWTLDITEELKKKRAPTNESKELSKANSSTSSLLYQRELNENYYAVLDKRHSKIKEKWTLKSGKVVEDLIFQKASHYKYEQ